MEQQKFDSGVSDQSTTSTPWKFDTVHRQNLMAPVYLLAFCARYIECVHTQYLLWPCKVCFGKVMVSVHRCPICPLHSAALDLLLWAQQAEAIHRFVPSTQHQRCHSMAHSSKCMQCHIVSRRRSLTDLFSIA